MTSTDIHYRATHNIYTPIPEDGVLGPTTIKALQYVLGVPLDGALGPVTVKALQGLLGVPVDGAVGPVTTRALQAAVAAVEDGQWGTGTTTALQQHLNAGTLPAPSRPTPSPAPVPVPPKPTPPPVRRGRVPIAKSAVTYGRYSGSGNVRTWATLALEALGLVTTSAWLDGYVTLCARESSGRANAVNTSDSNANGPTVSDGNPLNCSRGVAQCIPGTFASYHAAGTSNDIYDPVANIAASVNYVRDRYGVNDDGSNFDERVQQADPNRSPLGY